MVVMAAQGISTHAAATSTVLLHVIAGAPVIGRLLGASPAGLYLSFDPVGGTVAGAGSVIAVLPTSSVQLPLAMVTSDPIPSVLPDDSIVVGDGVLRVGTHAWQTVRWFDPKPSSHREPHPEALAEAAESLWNLSADEAGMPVAEAWEASAALAAGDPEPCRGLLGAGPGLTPAGDDVVAGAVAACALSGAGPRLHEVEMLIARASVSTTALSAALLWCASQGQVVPEAAELLRALGIGTAIAPALSHLRAVGSTSGTALAIGMVAALAAATAQLDPRSPLAGSASVTGRPASWAVAP